MLFSARIGVANRNRVIDLAGAWDMSLSDTLRALVILGVGGTWDDVLAANQAANANRDAVAENVQRYGGGEINQSRQQGPFVKQASADVVAVRLSVPWSDRLRQPGGFKAAVLRGLSIV
jgi:hypothetical protein